MLEGVEIVSVSVCVCILGWAHCVGAQVMLCSGPPCFSPSFPLSLPWEEDTLTLTVWLSDGRCDGIFCPLLTTPPVRFWTYDMSHLLPSHPPLLSSPAFFSSQLFFLSDLWPHKTSCWPLGRLLLLSCHLIFPRSSLVGRAGTPLSSALSPALCVIYSVCTCMLHARQYQCVLVSVYFRPGLQYYRNKADKFTLFTWVWKESVCQCVVFAQEVCEMPFKINLAQINILNTLKHTPSQVSVGWLCVCWVTEEVSEQDKLCFLLSVILHVHVMFFSCFSV